MKINNIKLNYGLTKNMGNFESLRVDVEFSATVGDNDAPVDVVENLRQMAKLECQRIVNGKIEEEKDDIPY